MFAFGCKASADDSYDVLVPFSEDHHDHTSRDGPDGDKTVFVVGMSIIEDLQVVGVGQEELLRFFEGDAVFVLVREVLALVPFEVHLGSMSQRRTKSMA